MSQSMGQSYHMWCGDRIATEQKLKQNAQMDQSSQSKMAKELETCIQCGVEYSNFRVNDSSASIDRELNNFDLVRFQSQLSKQWNGKELPLEKVTLLLQWVQQIGLLSALLPSATNSALLVMLPKLQPEKYFFDEVPILFLAGASIFLCCKNDSIRIWAEKINWTSMKTEAAHESCEMFFLRYFKTPCETPWIQSNLFQTPQTGFYTGFAHFISNIPNSVLATLSYHHSTFNFLYKNLDIVPYNLSMLILKAFYSIGSKLWSFIPVPDTLAWPKSHLLPTAFHCLTLHKEDSQIVKDSTESVILYIKSVRKMNNESYRSIIDEVAAAISACCSTYPEPTPIPDHLITLINYTCQVCFDHRPIMHTPPAFASVRGRKCFAYVNFDNPKSLNLLSSAISAESLCLYGNIIGHTLGQKEPVELFPHRMLVADIITPSNLIRLLGKWLQSCANLIIMDVTHHSLPPKTIKVLKRAHAATASVLKISSEHSAPVSLVNTIIECAIFYMSSSTATAPFTQFIANNSGKMGVMSVYQIFQSHIPQVVKAVRCMLWDLLMAKYNLYKSSWDLIARNLSRVLVNASKSNFSISDEIVMLIWLFCKHVLNFPSNGSIHDPSKEAVIKLFEVLIRFYSSSPTVKRALEFQSRWINTIHHLCSAIENPAIARAAQACRTEIEASGKSEIEHATETGTHRNSTVSNSTIISIDDDIIDSNYGHEKGSTIQFSSHLSSSSSTNQDISHHLLSNHYSDNPSNNPLGITSTSHSRPLPTSFHHSTPQPEYIHQLKPVAKPTLSVQERKHMDAELAKMSKTQEMKAAPKKTAPVMVFSSFSGTSMLMKQQMAITKEKQRRKKSVEELHQFILQMNYVNMNYAAPLELPSGKIPNKFASMDQYVSYFEPLLLYEIQAQMVQAKEERDPKVDVRLIARIAEVGSFHHVSIKFQDPQMKASRGGYDDDDHWRLNDVLLMWPMTAEVGIRDFTQSKQEGEKTIPHCIGIVIKSPENHRNDPIEYEVRLLLNHSPCPFHANITHQLVLNSKWNFAKIFSLTTASREWESLQTCDGYSCFKELLDPSLGNSSSVSSPYSALEVNKYVEKLKSMNLNESQTKSIQKTLVRGGLNFIQGPPGTGKTKCLVGMLSVLMHLNARPILVCTPSNSAIDEIIDRVQSQGLPDLSQTGKILSSASSSSSSTPTIIQTPKLVRLGTNPPDTPSSIQNITLSSLVKSYSGRATNRSDMETSILRKADIIFSTLTASGSPSVVQSNLEFKTVIIDEAAQAVELSTLIPLKYKCEHCILIGDPNQLPATVFSSLATKFSYERSLFARFAQSITSTRLNLLTLQYRMPPLIAKFPNDAFYSGKLTSFKTNTTVPWEDNDMVMSQSSAKAKLFGMLKFFNLEDAQSSTKGSTSLSNQSEAQFTLALIRQFYATTKSPLRISVVTPYQGQKSLLKRLIDGYNQRYESSQTVSPYQDLTISTIDGCQGQEEDIIILSTVRSHNNQNSIGFLADVRRMNVALTRAKTALWVIGQSKALTVNNMWASFISFVESQNLVVSLSSNGREWDSVLKAFNN